MTETKVKKDTELIRSTAFISICTAGLCLSSVFAIPLPFSAAMLSFLTAFVNLTALCLKRNEALLSVLLWLFMGAIGLPVFSGASGLSRLTSPAGGYYIGFVIAVFLISSFKGKIPELKRYILLTVLLGIPSEHICAVFFMSLTTGTSVGTCFMSISLPFIATDIIKAIASAVIAVPLNKAISKI